LVLIHFRIFTHYHQRRHHQFKLLEDDSSLFKHKTEAETNLNLFYYAIQSLRLINCPCRQCPRGANILNPDVFDIAVAAKDLASTYFWQDFYT
jgi:hypothetical protein